MPDPIRPTSRRSPRWRALSAAALMALAGCATHETAPTADSADPGAPLRDSLARQQRKPDARAMRAPPPALLIDEAGGPLEGEALERAKLPLDEAVWRIEQRAAQNAEPAIPLASEQPTDADRLDAKRAYVEGRRLRLAQENQRAENELRRAARLDPGSADIWREFGEVQLALGNMPLAQSAFRRAIDRDPDDIRSLDVLTRLMVERREDLEAVPLLVRMRRAPLAEFDAALPLIVSSRLGLALSRLGYDAAAAEAYRPSVELPDQFGATTNYAQELSFVYRQRGETARRLGDDALRRGDFAEAARDYAIAARVPSADPASLLARRVYTAMRAGQPADAAAILIERLKTPTGVPERETIDLLVFVDANSSSRGVARAAVSGELLATADPGAAGRLSRALAALSEPDQAVAILTERLGAFPADRQTLVALLELAQPRGISAQASALAPLVERSPADARLYATALAADHDGPRAALDAWPAPAEEQAAAVLLRAQLLSLAGRLEEVDTLLAPLPPDTAVGAHALALRAEALALLGRRREAEALAASIDPDAGAAQRLARALALDASGDHRAAAETIEPLIHAPSDSTGAVASRLMLASSMHEQAGNTETAIALASESVELDPTREQAYQALLRLRLPGSALADEDRFADTVRALRDNLPDSATMAWLRAQDAIRRRQFDAAERDARAHAEREPERAELLASLLTAWANGGSTDAGVSWLREQRDRWPGPPIISLALAEILESRADRAQALEVLEALWRATPGDDDASRAFESALRRDPDSALRADEIAETRLADAPRTQENLLDLIELSVRRGALVQADRWAHEYAALETTPSPLVAQRLERLIGAVTLAAMGESLDPAEALALQRTIIRAAPTLDPAAHFAAIELLVLLRADLPPILEAADAGARQHPEAAPAIYIETSLKLNPRFGDRTQRPIRMVRPEEALAVLEHGRQALGAATPTALYAAWFVQALQTDTNPGDSASCVRLFEAAGGVEPLREIIVAVAPRYLQRIDADPTATQAELATVFANAASRADRDDIAESAYRLALRIDPDQLNANNNLGYRLLEEGRNIEEAAALVQRAYDTAARAGHFEGNWHVVDSLGWARYKLGIIQDETDAQGRVVREGALTILRRVHDVVNNRIELAEAAPIIIDHYADALWAAGQHDRAGVMWAAANKRARNVIQLIQDPTTENARELLEELEPVVARTEAKLLAVNEKRPPPVASMARPANTGPAPDAPEPAPAPAIID